VNDIGVFTPEQARSLWQDYQRRQQLTPQTSQNYPQRRPIDEVSPHRVPIKNTSAETMPAYGCGRITGTVTAAGRTTVMVEKPSSTDGEFIFNSQFEIAAGEVGWGYRYGVVVMRGDGVAPSAANVKYSSIVGSFDITEASGPFVVFGEDIDTTYGLIGRIGASTSAVVTEVRFQIVSSDPTTFTGLAEVLAWDYGFTLQQVPDSILGSVIEICDPRTCFLNEPNVDLTGRQGTAVYRQGIADDICRTGYAPFPGVWEVDGLCCKLISCDVVI
jgi:hypothetical protein